MSVEDQASVPEVLEVDARGLDATGMLVHVAKSTRFLSRGTRVEVRSDRSEVQADLRAWAGWARHAYDGVSAGTGGAFVSRIRVYAAR